MCELTNGIVNEGDFDIIGSCQYRHENKEKGKGMKNPQDLLTALQRLATRLNIEGSRQGHLAEHLHQELMQYLPLMKNQFAKEENRKMKDAMLELEEKQIEILHAQMQCVDELQELPELIDLPDNSLAHYFVHQAQ